MSREPKLRICGSEELPVKRRNSERKLGEEVRTLDGFSVSELSDGLKSRREEGAEYALIGVPEDVGPRANLGRGGAKKGWEAFAREFLNMQSNRFLKGDEILFLGRVDLKDILEECRSLDNEKESDLRVLREKCNQIDERVYEAVRTVASSGLKPMVIGGGHNNAYPIIKAVSNVLKSRGKISEDGIATINCDAHLDFRPLEGRHSGNPFSYAFGGGFLKAYFAVGIHEGYNSEEMLRRIDKINSASERIGYTTFEEMLREGTGVAEAAEDGLEFLDGFGLPVGLELDMDSIRGMPTSAGTISGLTLEDARNYVSKVASVEEVPYLHISEGAPELDENGQKTVGRPLAHLVHDFIRADRS